ncbi:YIPF5-like protein [Rozella allomycis CSF55]|uniref:Protein YIP n=1 Tax=Rozella allomycis (strain CSF55) TaxID=988480 RepID=A0A4P9YJY1_ROZAC|nr:YIPF5-like protein [Rozella allomycis CSF55]
MQPQNVLFDQQQAYSNNSAQNLNFYQSNYDAETTGMKGPRRISNAHQPIGGRLFAMSSAFGSGGFADEPPLFEELGINFSHVKSKSLQVMNPVREVDHHFIDDEDLAGPLVFILSYGAFLLFSGKAHFGYIYGLALLGCISVYVILNLMSDKGIDGSRTASVLGYCLLPLVFLALLSLALDLKTYFGLVISLMCILWCTYSSSTIFSKVLNLKEQRILIAYPIGLLYTIFALMTIF